MSIHTRIPIKSSYSAEIRALGWIYISVAAIAPLLARRVFKRLRHATLLYNDASKDCWCFFLVPLFPFRPLSSDAPESAFQKCIIPRKTTVQKVIQGVVFAATFLAALNSTDMFTSVSIFHAPANGTAGHGQGYLAPAEVTDPAPEGCYMFGLPEENQYRACSKVLSQLQHNSHHMKSAAEIWQSENCSQVELIILEAVLSDKPVFEKPLMGVPLGSGGPLSPWHHMKESITTFKGVRIGLYKGAMTKTLGGSGAGATFDVRVMDPEGKTIENITANTLVSRAHGMKTGDFVTWALPMYIKYAEFGAQYTQRTFWIRAVDEDSVELYDTEAQAKNTKAHTERILPADVLRSGRREIVFGGTWGKEITGHLNSMSYGTLTKGRPVVAVSSHSLYVKGHGFSTGDQVTYFSAGETCIEAYVNNWCCYFFPFLASQCTNCIQDSSFLFSVRSTGVDTLELYWDSEALASAVEDLSMHERIRFVMKNGSKYGMLVRANGVVDDVQVSHPGSGYTVGDKLIISPLFGTISMKLREEDIATALGKVTKASTSDFEVMALLGIWFKVASAVLEGTAVGLMFDFLSTAVLSIPNSLQFSAKCIRYLNEIPVFGTGVFPIRTQLRVYHLISGWCSCVLLCLCCSLYRFIFLMKAKIYIPLQQVNCFFGECLANCLSGPLWLCLYVLLFVAAVLLAALAWFFSVGLAVLGLIPFCNTLYHGFCGNRVQQLNALLQLWKGLENIYYNVVEPLEQVYHRCRGDAPEQSYDEVETVDGTGDVTITISKADLEALARGKLSGAQLIKDSLTLKLVDAADAS